MARSSIASRRGRTRWCCQRRAARSLCESWLCFIFVCCVTQLAPISSTNVDYILRNLGVRQIVICGCLTDQCISSAVRDACDLVGGRPLENDVDPTLLTPVSHPRGTSSRF